MSIWKHSRNQFYKNNNLSLRSECISQVKIAPRMKNYLTTDNRSGGKTKLRE